MTHLEIVLSVIQIVQFGAIYWLTKYNRDLDVKNKDLSYESEQKHLTLMSMAEKLSDAQKKIKASTDVLEVLQDLKNGGTILHVERIDKNDVYFHNGGQYR